MAMPTGLEKNQIEELTKLVEQYGKAREEKKSAAHLKSKLIDYVIGLSTIIHNAIQNNFQTLLKEQLDSQIKSAIEDRFAALEDKLSEKVKDLATSLGTPIPSSSQADAVKSSKDHPVIIIEPNDEQTTPDQIEDELTRRLLTNDIDFIPYRTRKGRILVKARTDEDMEKLQSRLDAHSEMLTYHPPKLRTQRLFIYNAPYLNWKDWTKRHSEVSQYKENLAAAINKELNTSLRTIDFQSFRTIKSSKNTNRSHILLTLEEKYAKQLLNIGTITLGFIRCKIDKHRIVPRCSNCHEYSHIKRECTNQIACGICSGPHSLADCEYEFWDNPEYAFCKNCNEENTTKKTNHPLDHSPNSGRCPIYQSLQKHFLRNEFRKK